ncbi:hypothetical protein ACNOIU_16025 (plasmid) [Exiguobacterium mexicanum]|uniref:Uncharacterized protein n=1 Tax=Exiguobacterium mexicanum TaxID=340146 RepID=A0ABT7MTB2_9BACL|nr:hypothetical protein [Exiguobacterium mexicanum]MDL5378444.1 hypothetical protein [Exiguobacterium mexicanum]
MKKITLMLSIFVLAFATFIVPAMKTEAATATVIWKHPRDAKEIGYQFSTTKKITRADLNNISTYFDNREANRNMQASLASGIMVLPVSPYLGLGVGTAVAALTTYINTHGKLVTATLKKSTSKTFTVKINYRYKQVGSNDGYYYIDTIKIY